MFLSRNTNPQSNLPRACANIWRLKARLKKVKREKLRVAHNHLASVGYNLRYGFSGNRKFCIHSYRKWANPYRRAHAIVTKLERKYLIQH